MAHAPGSGGKTVDPPSLDLLPWNVTDHLNTVRDIARYDSESDTTTVVNHLVYDACGNVTSETNSAVDSLFLFTARPFDPDTGLQNNLHRWYDPLVGRWLSEDPAQADQDLYRYCHNNPVAYVDPTGLIDVRKEGPHYGQGSPLPTDQANNITTNYEFFGWLNTDLGGMLQNVKDEGTFSFSTDHAGGSVSWRESYYEGWVRRPMNRRYSFTDHHSASPEPAARAVENFFGRKFRHRPNNTLFLGDWEVCSWDLTMKATFDMRNAWRSDWVPMLPGRGVEAYFGGAGSHTWQASIFAYVVGGGGGIAWLESNNGALYGFAKMLFPDREGVAPPVGNWAWGQYHVTSHESWTESWKRGQATPTMKYDGGYGPAH